MGYRLYEIRPGPAAGKARSPVRENVMENDFFRLRIDPQTGGLASIYDKERKRELLDPGSAFRANQILYFAGEGDTQQMHTNESVKVEGIPFLSTAPRCDGAPTCIGPVFGSARVRSRTLHTPDIESVITLYRTLPRIDIVNRMTKNETYDKEGVYFAFPFAVQEPQFHFEGPDSIVNPAEDMLKGACLDWFAVQHWVDVTGPEAGVTWACPDSPLVCLGDLTVGQELREFEPPSGSLIAYVMNNYWDRNYRAGQGGEITFRYAMTSHGAGMDPVAATRFGWECANPLETTVLPAGRNGILAEPASSFCSIQEDNTVVLTFKKAEDKDGWILRLWEIGGNSGTVHVRFPRWKVSRAFLANLVEENEKELGVSWNVVAVPVDAHSVVTVRIRK